MRLLSGGGVSARVAPALAAALAVAVLLAGCSAPAQAERKLPGKHPSQSAGTPEPSLDVGDCLVAAGADAETRQRVVPCSEPHDVEAFASIDLDEAELPGDEALWAVAEEHCGPQFELFIGMPYTQSSMDWFFRAPDEAAWHAGARRLVCIVYDPAGRVTGSLVGAAR